MDVPRSSTQHRGPLPLAEGLEPRDTAEAAAEDRAVRSLATSDVDDDGGVGSFTRKTLPMV